MATPLQPLIALSPEQEDFLTAKRQSYSAAEQEAVERHLAKLTPDDLAWLHCRLAVTRHDVNGKLLAINLAFELTQIRAELAEENAVRIAERISLVEQELVNYLVAFEQRLGLAGRTTASARPLTPVQVEELADGLNAMPPGDRAVLQGRLPHVPVEMILWLHSRYLLSQWQIHARLTDIRAAAKVMLQSAADADAPSGAVFSLIKDIEHELLNFTCEFEHRLTFPDKSKSILPWRMVDAKA